MIGGGHSFVEGGSSGRDAFGYDDDWQPLSYDGNNWVAVGLFVNNDAEHGGTQLLDFANRMAGHESEYTLVIVARIRESYTPWLQIYGFSEIVDNNSIHVYDQIEPDGEWHIIQISCADLGAMKAEYLYDSRTDDGNGHTLIPGYKANLYSYGTGYGLAEVCAVWYAKY